MNLHQYLLNIKSDKAINLERFISLLPALYKQQWRSVFSCEKDHRKKNSHKLTIINQQSFDLIFENSLPATNRVEASDRGNSHQENTSFSFLLLFHQALNTTHHGDPNTCPEVVVVTDEGVQQNFISKKNLLIIENQENFFRWPQFLSVLTQFCPLDIALASITLADFDIAFGSGNNITNSKNSAFFKQYQHISCSFDYDLGGLTIFKSLSKLCAKADTQEKITLSFLQPEEAYLSNAVFTQHYFNKTPKHSGQWQRAITLANELGFNELAQAFHLSKKFMEQESYLSAALDSRALINNSTRINKV